MITLQISCGYLSRELSEKDRDVRGWIAAYASRNRIPCQVIRNERVNDEPYLRLEFRSRHQRECFVRRGNQEFPYFEFR